MTVIYTETHLMSDPVKNFETKILSFNIALSSISVQCRVHREELVDYILAHKLRTGDLIQIFGVFLTETEPTELYYININKVSLIDKFDLQTGKKRKYEDLLKGDPATWVQENTGSIDIPMALENDNWRLDTNLYVNVTGEFSDYFFMLYGKVQYACQSVTSYTTDGSQEDPLSKTIQQLQQLQQESMRYLHGALSQVYDAYAVIQNNGSSKENVLKFVQHVKDLTDRIYVLNKSSSHAMPAGLVMDQKIYLPTLIYNLYESLGNVA